MKQNQTKETFFYEKISNLKKMKKILSIVLLILLFAIPVFASTPVIDATFHSIGVEWNPDSGDGNTCTLEYRITGAGSWSDALNMYWDSGDGLYRGSVLNVEPDTDYDIRVDNSSDTETVSPVPSASGAPGSKTTWSETFNIGATTTLNASYSSTYTIGTSGTEDNYHLYDCVTNSTVIDLNSANANGIDTNGHDYIIIRGCTIRDTTANGIWLEADSPSASHHVIIEDCDISDFGNASWEGGISVTWSSPNVTNIIIQRNKIHDPGIDANSWCEPTSGTHPEGPYAINWMGIGELVVIRYNSIYTSGNMFHDGICHAETSVSNANHDIYGNYIQGVWDDAIQPEGYSENMRIWGNFIRNSHHGTSSNPIAVGPMYFFRNVIVPDDTPTWCGYFRGGLLKTTSTAGQGMKYVIHNTMLWDPNLTDVIQGANTGIGSGGNNMRDMWTRNNILHVRSGGASIAGSCSGDCSFDYELYNGSISQTVTNGISGTPTYDPTPSYTLSEGTHGTGTFTLESATDGHDDGVVIANFNDGYQGSAPDMGAHERGLAVMEFGVTAYLAPTATAPSPPSGLMVVTQ